MKLHHMGLIVLLAVVMLFATSSPAWAAEGWTTDSNTGCKIGIVFLTNDTTLVSASWTGPAVNGKAEGKGKLIYVYKEEDGKEIEVQGEAVMVAGLLDGKEALKWPPDGNSYDGDYKAGLRDGRGILKWTNGQVYDGGWKNGLFNGYGVLKDANGKVLYEGDWKDGRSVSSTTLKADKILGIPWNASEDEAKNIMHQRAQTVSLSSDKDAGRKWQFYKGVYNEEEAYFHVMFYQEKMYEVSVSILVGEVQVMEKLNTVKQGLSKRYGIPISENGKDLDSSTHWDLGGGYEAELSIVRSTVSTQPPFIVTIQYYNSKTNAIVREALYTIKSKDY